MSFRSRPPTAEVYTSIRYICAPDNADISDIYVYHVCIASPEFLLLLLLLLVYISARGEELKERKFRISKGDENGKDVANVELSERGKEFAFFSLGERLLDTLEFVKLNRRSRIYLSRASVNPPEFESPLTFPFRDLKISRRKSKFDEHRRSESLLSFLFLLLF